MSNFFTFFKNQDPNSNNIVIDRQALLISNLLFWLQTRVPQNHLEGLLKRCRLAQVESEGAHPPDYLHSDIILLFSKKGHNPLILLSPNG